MRNYTDIRENYYIKNVNNLNATKINKKLIFIQ